MEGILPLLVGLVGVIEVIATYRRWPVVENDSLWRRNVRHGVGWAIKVNYIIGAAMIVFGFGGFAIYYWGHLFPN